MIKPNEAPSDAVAAAERALADARRAHDQARGDRLRHRNSRDRFVVANLEEIERQAAIAVERAAAELEGLKAQEVTNGA